MVKYLGKNKQTIKVVIFYITELIAIRPPLLILHFKNFLNMKIQSLAKLHVKPKHRRVSRRKSNGSWSFFGPAFQIEKKRRGKKKEKDEREAERGRRRWTQTGLWWEFILFQKAFPRLSDKFSSPFRVGKFFLEWSFSDWKNGKEEEKSFSNFSFMFLNPNNVFQFEL